MMRKIIRFMIAGIIVFASPALFQTPGFAADFYVVDGDTFSLHGEKYRIWGIDAVERKQTCSRGGTEYSCGMDAKRFLQSLIDPAGLKCQEKPRSRKETRTVALCTVKGRDIGLEMVSAGWAIDYEYFSHGFYAAAEKDARDAKRGLWAGEFQPPRNWRRDHPW